MIGRFQPDEGKGRPQPHMHSGFEGFVIGIAGIAAQPTDKAIPGQAGRVVVQRDIPVKVRPA